MKKLAPVVAALLVGLALPACTNQRVAYPSAQSPLKLTRVVLYRNGVGYFERQGKVESNVLRIKVRKDQVNDLLKSLTVVAQDGGQALSISMPLDPRTWANAALATLAPGRGSLAKVLDALRGTWVELSTAGETIEGRILMVEKVTALAPPKGMRASGSTPLPPRRDHNITLLDGKKMRIVRLSKVKSVKLADGDLAMQFNRSLDASAGEGMFQQVEVAVRLKGAIGRRVLVSYVAPAPMWKPTYRVVLPEKGKGKALLQAWAVVDNVSGEDWSDVALALTSGAPIAFRYDLHTPRMVDRADLTSSGVRKHARVAIGETSYDDEVAVEKDEGEKVAESRTAMSAPAGAVGAGGGGLDATGRPYKSKRARRGYGSGKGRGIRSRAKKRDHRPMAKPSSAMYASEAAADRPAPAPSVDFAALRRSTMARARAKAVAGLTRFDLSAKVTLPDGASSMVAIVNQPVEAEETFLFKPGGAGTGYEANPYRVVRFRNSTPFVLEPGPISIYAGGSFVGEGLSEAVGASTSATIPFAVEPSIMVTSRVDASGRKRRLLRVVRGVLEVESFARTSTTWKVRTQIKRKTPVTVLVRHPKAGQAYQLVARPPKTEDLRDAYLIPVSVPVGQNKAQVKVVEQTPTVTHISIWERSALKLLNSFLVSGEVTSAQRRILEPVIMIRRSIGRIDTKIEGLRQQRRQLDQRASETRENLKAIQKDKAAVGLRRKLNKRLEEFTSSADKVGRQIVELQSKRLEKKIELEDKIEKLDLRVASPKK